MIMDPLDATSYRPCFGISGKAFSGKSTWALEIAKQAVGMQVLSFAGELKRHVQEIFDVPVHGPDKNRELLQRFGTEWCRSVDEDVWVKALLRDWRKRGRPPCVVDDVRFPNEFKALRGAGFIMVRLACGEDVRAKRAAKLGAQLPPAHPSETALDLETRWNFIFTTDRMTMREVRQEAKNLLYKAWLLKVGN